MEDEDGDIDEMVEMEMLEDLGEIEEEDDDDETEEEAIERIKMELTEKYEDEMTNLERVQVYEEATA